MNILLVTMSMQIGGAETHVLELAKGLKKRGYTVYVMSNGGEYVRELEDNNIEHIHAPIHNRNFSNMMSSYKILKQTIIDKKIDIVHAHARIPAMIANKACKATKVPMVTTAHGVYKVNPILKLLTNWGEKTIAVSEDVKDYLIKEYGIEEKNISITVNGIDTEKFNKSIDCSDIVNELKIDPNKKHIVHVSRLDTETSVVANCLMEIAKDFENIQFVIVGSGTEYDTLKNNADKVNEESSYKKIVMAGGRTDVNKFDALSDIFIGVSRAAFEAMAAEKPVILAGNQGYIGIFEENSLNKALETNFCGRGLELPNVSLLKSNINKLLEISDAETVKMGKYNREVILKHYSLDRMIEDAVEMYEKTLN